MRIEKSINGERITNAQFCARKLEQHEIMCLGIPGRVVEITDVAQQLALIDVGGVRREINLACIVDEDHPLQACVGEWVLVHVGFAMNRIDEHEAAETLALLRQLGEIQAEQEAMRAADAATDSV